MALPNVNLIYLDILFLIYFKVGKSKSNSSSAYFGPSKTSEFRDNPIDQINLDKIEKAS